MKNKKMKILIVEDDSQMAKFLKTNLESESFVVDVASNGADGSYIARTNTYDLIILDYSLPKKNGLEVCKDIRTAGKSSRIIFLSVLGELPKKIDALNKGADDYMTKPFSFDELLSRVKALLRRPHKIESTILNVGDLRLDIEKQIATRGKTTMYLTRKEFNLLEYLMRNQGSILSRGMIMEHVWNAESDPFSNTIEAHVLNLRKKINIGSRKDLIKNIPGRGYIMEST